ncbi:hypothetical protein ACFSZS_18845 [Seohaeicola zhoushanensis]
MQVFFAAHGATLSEAAKAPNVPRRVRRRQEEICEEALLEAFARS